MLAPDRMRHLERKVANTRDSIQTNTPRGKFFPARATFLFLVTCTILLGNAHPARATASEICDFAARKAALETGVPIFILQAITRTETGRGTAGRLAPWPWTVNMEGNGYWFESESAAKNFVHRRLARGSSSFDVGCFQLNYKWHGNAFRSVDQMFDPFENALYAARFLAKLYAETGDWSSAAGSYHSRTPKYARAYRARFDQILRQQDTWLAISPVGTLANQDHAANIEEVRTNSYPLLTRANSTFSRGSLVPLGSHGQRAFVDITAISEGS